MKSGSPCRKVKHCIRRTGRAPALHEKEIARGEERLRIPAPEKSGGVKDLDSYVARGK